jgi:hypothetical protein
MAISTRQRTSRRCLITAGTATAVGSFLPGVLSTPRGTEASPGVPSNGSLLRTHQTATPSASIEFRQLYGGEEENLLRQRYLWDLQLWEDRIYAGYGDWELNSEGVAAIYLNAATGVLNDDDDFVFDDGAIDSFVVINGELWAVGAATLADEAPTFGNLYRKPPGGAWTKLATVPNARHLFGLGQVNGVFVVSGIATEAETTGGATGSEVFGAIWQSFDGAQTWELVTTFGVPSSQRSPYRFMSSIMRFDDRLVVATPRSGSFSFDGFNWVSGNAVPHTIYGVTKAVQLGEFSVMAPYIPRAYTWAGPLTTSLVISDGDAYWTVETGVTIRDLIVDEGRLYALATDPWGGLILAADDLSCRCLDAFEVIAELDPMITPCSIEFSRNRFIVGCVDGSLLRSNRHEP